MIRFWFSCKKSHLGILQMLATFPKTAARSALALVPDFQQPLQHHQHCGSLQLRAARSIPHNASHPLGSGGKMRWWDTCTGRWQETKEFLVLTSAAHALQPPRPPTSAQRNAVESVIRKNRIEIWDSFKLITLIKQRWKITSLAT